MVEANSQAIQNEIEDFKPDERIYFSVGNACYDAVHQPHYENGKIVKYTEGMKDIHHATQDCWDLLGLLEKYDFEFRSKEEIDEETKKPSTAPGVSKNCYICENAKKQEINDEWKKVENIVKANPMKKYLIICLYAGHGQMAAGNQTLLCNKLSDEGYYELY